MLMRRFNTDRGVTECADLQRAEASIRTHFSVDDVHQDVYTGKKTNLSVKYQEWAFQHEFAGIQNIVQKLVTKTEGCMSFLLSGITGMDGEGMVSI